MSILHTQGPYPAGLTTPDACCVYGTNIPGSYPSSCPSQYKTGFLSPSCDSAMKTGLCSYYNPAIPSISSAFSNWETQVQNKTPLDTCPQWCMYDPVDCSPIIQALCDANAADCPYVLQSMCKLVCF
jgi:hypothetical protein